MLNGYDDRTDIAFAFRTESEIEYDYRNRAQQRVMIHDHFGGLGWKVPAALNLMGTDDDFYFDRINQIDAFKDDRLLSCLLRCKARCMDGQYERTACGAGGGADHAGVSSDKLSV